MLSVLCDVRLQSQISTSGTLPTCKFRAALTHRPGRARVGCRYGQHLFSCWKSQLHLDSDIANRFCQRGNPTALLTRAIIQNVFGAALHPGLCNSITVHGCSAALRSIRLHISAEQGGSDGCRGAQTQSPIAGERIRAGQGAGGASGMGVLRLWADPFPSLC